MIQRDEEGDEYLAAAMFMLPDGTTLDDVPAVGGPLVQCHVHENLCFTDDPVAEGDEHLCTEQHAHVGDG